MGQTFPTSSTRGQGAIPWLLLCVLNLWVPKSFSKRSRRKEKGSQYPNHNHVGLQQDLRKTGLQHVQADVWHYGGNDKRKALSHIVLSLSSVPTPLPEPTWSLPRKLRQGAGQRVTYWVYVKHALGNLRTLEETDKASFLVFWQLLTPAPITVALTQKLASC